MQGLTGSIGMILVLVFACTLGCAYLLFRLFSDGWKMYEENYLRGTARGLDAMFIAMPPQLILFASALAAIVLAVVIGLALNSLVFAGMAAICGLFLPRGVFWILKSRRDRLFKEQLSDALMSMSNSLKAGFSLYQAFEMIQKEMKPPVSQEFRLLVQQLKFGMPMDEALSDLHKRMPSDDLDLVISSISIAKDVGGNLTETFDNIAFTIRERQKMEGRIKALTSQGKMQGGIMCLLPFAVAAGVNFVNPKLMEPMFESPMGWLLLGAVVVLELLGIYFIKKIVTIDV